MDPGAGPQVGLGVGEELMGTVVDLEDGIQCLVRVVNYNM